MSPEYLKSNIPLLHLPWISELEWGLDSLYVFDTFAALFVKLIKVGYTVNKQKTNK